VCVFPSRTPTPAHIPFAHTAFSIQHTAYSIHHAPPTNTRNRGLDPLFAISIGLAAAVTRINREEKEKGRSTQQIVDVARRRWGIAWEGKA
jgi:hypothetical protein